MDLLVETPDDANNYKNKLRTQGKENIWKHKEEKNKTSKSNPKVA